MLCPPCKMNPANLICSCKGFRHIGICSHCVAVNHWLPDTEIDLEEIMVSLEGEKTRKRSKGGYRKGVRPALTKEGPGKAATHKSQKKKKKAIK